VIAKIQAAIDTALAALTPADIADLTAHGTESSTFARLVQSSDPFWPKAIVAQLQ